MKNLLLMLLIINSLISSAFADRDVNCDILSSEDSKVLCRQNQRILRALYLRGGDGRDSSDQSTMTVNSKTCAHSSDYGTVCDYYNEESVTGRFCAVGKICAHSSNFGTRCDFYNEPAFCGKTQCNVKRECAHSSNYGTNCDYYNEIVTCE